MTIYNNTDSVCDNGLSIPLKWAYDGNMRSQSIHTSKPESKKNCSSPEAKTIDAENSIDRMKLQILGLDVFYYQEFCKK